LRVPTSDLHATNACWSLFLLSTYLVVAEAASFDKKELCRSDTTILPFPSTLVLALSPFSSLYPLPTSLYLSFLSPFLVLSNFSSLYPLALPPTPFPSSSLYLLFLPSTHSPLYLLPSPSPFYLPFLPFIHLPLYSLPSSHFYFLSLPTIP